MALCIRRLGDNYDQQKVYLLAHEQQTFQRERLALVRGLETHTLRPEEYLDRLAALMKEVFSFYELILGKEDFQRLFGITSPAEALGIIDSQVFLAQNR